MFAGISLIEASRFILLCQRYSLFPEVINPETASNSLAG
jgi:hypothetical protein